MITIEIQTDNAAFEGGCREIEIAWILRQAARRIEETGETFFDLRDKNGYVVGMCIERGEKK